MRLVIDYMHDNAGQDVTLDDLAAIAHVSKYHLVRAFMRSADTTDNHPLVTEPQTPDS